MACKKVINHHNRAKVERHRDTGKKHLAAVKELEERAANVGRLQALYASLKQKVAQAEGGETGAPGAVQLPVAQLAWRHEMLERGLRAGVSIAQLGALRPLFNDPRHGFGGEHEDTFRRLVPQLRDTERAKVLQKLGSKWWSFEFDGTPHCGDLVGVVLRFFDDDFTLIHQMVFKVGHLPKSPDAEVLAWKLTEMMREFVTILLRSSMTCSRLHMENLVGFTRDSASVNGSALANLGILVSKAVKLVCFSHVTNRWGQAISVPLVDQLISNMNLLLGHSASVRSLVLHCRVDLRQAQGLFRLLSGVSWPAPSPTRWYSYLDSYRVALDHMTAILQLASHDALAGSACAGRLRQLLSDINCRWNLTRELICVVHYGSALAKACYELEADGQVIFKAHDIYRNVESAFSEAVGILPQVQAALMVASQQFFPDLIPDARQQLVGAACEACLEMIRPARVYGADQRLKKHNSDTLAIFELARMWDPSSGTPPSLMTLRALVDAARLGPGQGFWALPRDWLPKNDLDELEKELPKFITEVGNHLRVGQIKVLFPLLPALTNLGCPWMVASSSRAATDLVKVRVQVRPAQARLGWNRASMVRLHALLQGG